MFAKYLSAKTDMKNINDISEYKKIGEVLKFK